MALSWQLKYTNCWVFLKWKLLSIIAEFSTNLENYKLRHGILVPTNFFCSQYYCECLEMYLICKHTELKMKLGHFSSVTGPNIFFKSRRWVYVCQPHPLKHRNPRILKAANLLNPISKRISMVSTLLSVSHNNRIFIPTQYLLLKPCGKLKPEQDLLREQQMKLTEHKRWY